MTDSPPNEIFTMTAKRSAHRKEEKRRKSSEEVKDKRHKNKYDKKIQLSSLTQIIQ